MKALKKVLNTIINILIVVILVVSVLIAVMALSSKATGGISTIFGYTIENIQTDSMKGGSDKYEGGDFSAGDVIIGKYTEYIFTEEYNEGDIVTFMEVIEDVDAEKKQPVCHRIIEVAEYQGTKCYRTQGDNTLAPDQAEGEYAYYLTATDIASVFYSKDYHGVVLKGFGNVLNFLQSKLGFFLVVLLPMIFFFLYELIRVIFNAANYKNEKKREAEKQENEEKEKDQQAQIDAAVEAALKKREEELRAELQKEQAASEQQEPEREEPARQDPPQSEG